MSRARTSKPVAVKGLRIDTLARTPFFDIPIYRVCEKQYNEDFETWVRKREDSLDPNTSARLKKLKQDDPVQERQRRERLLRSFGGNWQFNEIVGYIRLHFVGSQIRGTYWTVEKQRLVKTRTKQMSFRSYKVVHELDIPMNPSNEKIFQTILAYLGLAKHKLKPRFLDTSIFERIGGFVDWQGLRKT